MLRFLLQRPIAVTMSLIALLALSVLAYIRLPVSLLPSIDVPEIIIAIRYPNGSPEEIEQNILKPIRENILTLNGLKATESIAQNETGRVTLRFEFGTSMNLAYIEANEKIDRLISILPRNLERPIVIKSNTSDLPMVRVQVVPKVDNDMLRISELSVKVLKRRLEQLDGVGLVDINGTEKNIIRISPDYATLRSLKLTDSDIAKTIENANLELGSISVKDGNYRYFLKLAAKINSPKEIEELPVILPEGSGSIRLRQLATINYEPEKHLGFHLFGTRQALVITVHKQAQAKLPELIPKIYTVIEQFKTDYPQLDFYLTQDQSLLLTLSIQNLSQSLVWGGLFAFGILFLFMRGWREPLIMGIVLPLSLLLAFSLFYLFNISLNIISLSGLALGLGMLVDNSIVVIDNIMLKRKEGKTVLDSCVEGTQEVIVPLFSSALTNLAVFVPLIFMSGITGALFFDQAISVASILSVSVLCTFILVPLLYLLFFKNKESQVQDDSRFFIAMKAAYSRSFLLMWRNKKVSLLLMTMFIPLTAILLWMLPREGFPEIERTETLIAIDWNEPIDAIENRKRITDILNVNASVIHISECEVGYQQFLLSRQTYSVQHAQLYFAFKSQAEKEKVDLVLEKYLLSKFPLATVEFTAAPNAFEQLFATGQPQLEARFRDVRSKRVLTLAQSDSLVNVLNKNLTTRSGKGFETETMAFIHFNFNNIKTYGLNYQDIINQLKIAFGDHVITNFKDFGEVTPVVFDRQPGDFDAAIKAIEVTSKEGVRYAIKDFVTIEYRENYKNITADASGIYQSVSVDDFDDVHTVEATVTEIAKKLALTVDYTGQWFETRDNFEKLTVIMIISLLLMYFILTAEFESLKQPLLVMITFPIGFAGSLILLWLTGGSLNIMSGIGFVVVLGILDNDAILKIDRINRLRETLPLEQAIKQAGLDRLKPIVMNTCTNVLAITPIIFSSGIGADLQRPVAITTIGGLIVGTFTALYFVPLVYWFISKNSIESNSSPKIV